VACTICIDITGMVAGIEWNGENCTSLLGGYAFVRDFESAFFSSLLRMLKLPMPDALVTSRAAMLMWYRFSCFRPMP
jgi:hypothetical protein